MNETKSEALGAARTKVLLTDTHRWALASRLAISLADAGCQVSAVCPMPGHSLAKTHAVNRTFRYSGLGPLESIAAAIEAVDPDMIIPACDRSVGHLHELYALSESRGSAGTRMMALIERSLGSPTSYPLVSSRYELLALAREEGVRVPSMSRINAAEDIDSWWKLHLSASVLKVDGTWGGGGVKVVESADEAQHSFTQLAQMFRLPRAIKRLVVNQDPYWLRPWWNRSKHAVMAQSYIHGRPSNCAAVCWKGHVLASIGVEVISSEGLTGPASVVRLVDNAEMTYAAERIALRLGLSGFFGLDFVIEEGSNAAYLIEMNPRSAPPCHLRLGKGHDLAGALAAQLSGQELAERPPVTQHQLIAYFPQAFESREDLQNCFLDAPQGEPELVEEMLNPYPNRTLLYRLVQRLSRKSSPNADAAAQKTYQSSQVHSELNGEAALADAPPTPSIEKARAQSR